MASGATLEPRASAAAAPSISARASRPACPLCGGPGATLYADLRDVLFGAAGAWGVRRCSATGCGLHWLDPAPSPEALGLAYADYYTHEPAQSARESTARGFYAALRRGYQGARWGRRDAPLALRVLGLLLALHPGRRADADFDAFYLRARPGARLLDVGCGSGRLLAALADLGWDVEGIDFDPDAVEAARSRGFRAALGDLPAQRYPDGAFDALTASHVLEHVPDPIAFVRECARVVAPGGSIVLCTPNAAGLGHRRFGRAWRGLEPPRHLHLFTPRSLERLAREAGLADARVRTTVRNARGIELASRAIARAQARGLAHAQPDRPDAAAELRQLAQWLATLVRPSLGEELVLVARTRGSCADISPASGCARS